MMCVNCSHPLTGDQIAKRIENVRYSGDKPGPFCSNKCSAQDRQRRIDERRAAA